MEQANKKILLTKEKINKLKLDLEQLIKIERPKIIAAIQAAREQGDLSENADYDAAKQRQGEIESKISEIQYTLNNCEIIKTNSSAKTTDKIKVGTTVELFDLQDKETKTYSIVGTIEADPDNNKISNESPLALAILNKQVDDIVTINGLENPYKVKIIKIYKSI